MKHTFIKPTAKWIELQRDTNYLSNKLYYLYKFNEKNDYLGFLVTNHGKLFYYDKRTLFNTKYEYIIEK